MWIEQRSLIGPRVHLEPLRTNHLPELAAIIDHDQLWRARLTSIPKPDGIQEWFDQAMARRVSCGDLPFTVFDVDSGRAVGSTRLCNPDEANRRIEIGYTWYASSSQRTHVNTASKHLLLTHAFENLRCRSVVFQTHRLNRRSRAAIERLGARLDGILRNHRIMPDGTMRDTAVYSIVACEWPDVDAHVRHLLESHTA